MTAFDIQVLRAVSGEKVEGLAWGAAMSVAIEFLGGHGLVRKVRSDDRMRYVLTATGQAYLAEATKREAAP